MKIELCLEPEQISEIVRLSLTESYNIESKIHNESNYELIKSLMTVIEYYSTREEYKEFITSITEGSEE